MRKILGFITISCFLTTLTACYHPDIQQGNDYSIAQMNQVTLGMSRAQVIALLGNPVLQNTFNNDQLTYIDTNYPNRGKITTRKVILFFNNDRLVKIEK